MNDYEVVFYSYFYNFPAGLELSSLKCPDALRTLLTTAKTFELLYAFCNIDARMENMRKDYEAFKNLQQASVAIRKRYICAKEQVLRCPASNTYVHDEALDIFLVFPIFTKRI